MNSFFIQSTIPEKVRVILADQLRLSAKKVRIESEIWQSADTKNSLQTALGHTSPTIVAVGSRAWLDQIITLAHSLKLEELPVFGHIPFVPTRLHVFTPLLIRREVTSSINALAARKVSHMTALQIQDCLFTETCTVGIKDATHPFSSRFAIQLHNGALTLSTPASRIDFSLVEGFQEDTPLIRLGVRSTMIAPTNSKPQSSNLLPQKRNSLRTNKYEDALHVPIERGTVQAPQPLYCFSQPTAQFTDSLSFQPYPQKLRIITSKNQPIRY